MPSLTTQARSDLVAAWFTGRWGPPATLRMMDAGRPIFCNRFWLPITDLATDGVWVDSNTGMEAAFTDWKAGEPNGGLQQNCGNLVPPRGWTDRPCKVGLPSPTK